MKKKIVLISPLSLLPFSVSAAGEELGEKLILAYRYSLGLGGILAAVMLMVGGLIWLTSAGSADKISRTKQIISNSLLGLVLLLSAVAILKFVNPDLTRLFIKKNIGVVDPLPPKGCCRVIENGKETVYSLTKDDCIKKTKEINKSLPVEFHPNMVANPSLNQCIDSNDQMVCCLTIRGGTPKCQMTLLSDCQTIQSSYLTMTPLGRKNCLDYADKCNLNSQCIDNEGNKKPDKTRCTKDEGGSFHCQNGDCVPCKEKGQSCLAGGGGVQCCGPLECTAGGFCDLSPAAAAAECSDPSQEGLPCGGDENSVCSGGKCVVCAKEGDWCGSAGFISGNPCCFGLHCKSIAWGRDKCELNQ
ncbi:hypothetical protein D6821_00420 [Candidatus Parcubacteria bacterium]|nr:MAG: hypothetical protein D6821_00420 [Candidatus Parcubacteria bacterium]